MVLLHITGAVGAAAAAAAAAIARVGARVVGCGPRRLRVTLRSGAGDGGGGGGTAGLHGGGCAPLMSPGLRSGASALPVPGWMLTLHVTHHGCPRAEASPADAAMASDGGPDRSMAVAHPWR